MKNYIVLLKQVPDIKEIDDNAFNKETGTLIRSKLKNVLNELDAEALSFANRLKELEGNEGKVVCLTMGPPMAEEVLKYALARNADEVILLTDRALGGADTVATASPLAEAIRKIQKDYFNNNDNYYIIAGMQSVDGDTAQVPAQIAGELDIPCIPFLTNVEKFNDKIVFSALTISGQIKVTPLKTPVVLTVAKYGYKLYPSFEKTRLAGKSDVTIWDASSIPNAKYIGGNGSKTQVVRVFAPEKIKRKCIQLNSVPELINVIKDSIAVKEKTCNIQDSIKYKLISDRDSIFDRSFEGLDKDREVYEQVQKALEKFNISDLSQISEEVKEKLLNDTKLRDNQLNDILTSYNTIMPSYAGDVFVLCEVRDNDITNGSFEVLGKVRTLADSLKVKACAILLGSNVNELAKKLIAKGADKVYVVDNENLNVFDPFIFKEVICQLLREYKPQIVLYSATYQGRVVAPMISYQLECGLTADCTSLSIGDNSKKNEIGILMQTRPALGGNIMATICTKNSSIQMATMREGVMKQCEYDNHSDGEIIEIKVQIDLSKRSFEVIENSMLENKHVEFSKEIILAGGRGLGNKDNFCKYIKDASKILGDKLNCPVSFGASRVAVEQGFIERDYQIGQTGTAVSPKVYIACGISGAIQHTIGIQNSNTIIAINNDKNAPIFSVSDYYIVGNVESIIKEILDNI